MKQGTRLGKIRPALCALPVQHEVKQLLVGVNYLPELINLWVTCVFQIVKVLLLVDDIDCLLGLLQKLLNCSDVCYILFRKS